MPIPEIRVEKNNGESIEQVMNNGFMVFSDADNVEK